MTEIILVRAVQTCSACPSQWNAWDLDGNYWYLRYRSGYGSMTREEGAIHEGLYFNYGDGLDGYIELEDFCREIGVTWAPWLDPERG